MEYRPLEITIVSAKGLKKVKHVSKMDVYMISTVSGDPRIEQATPIAKDGGTSPMWNHAMKFNINESLRQTITFKLNFVRTIRGDKDIGEAPVPLGELLKNAAVPNSPTFVTYPVRNPSGKPKGELNFLFKFGDKINSFAFSPVTAYPSTTNIAYPAPQNAGALSSMLPYHQQQPMPIYPPAQQPMPTYPHAGYPPVGYQQQLQNAAGGYGYHGQGGYPVQQEPQPPAGNPVVRPAGYGGSPPVVQPQQTQREEVGGAALGAVLVGGVLGGLLFGDMMSDQAAAYDAGHVPDFRMLVADFFSVVIFWSLNMSHDQSSRFFFNLFVSCKLHFVGRKNMMLDESANHLCH